MVVERREKMKLNLEGNATLPTFLVDRASQTGHAKVAVD